MNIHKDVSFGQFIFLILKIKSYSKGGSSMAKINGGEILVRVLKCYNI